MSHHLTPFDAPPRDESTIHREPWWVSLVACLVVPTIAVLLVAVWWACEHDCTSPKDRAPVEQVRR